MVNLKNELLIMLNLYCLFKDNSRLIEVINMVFCIQCGTENPEDAKFCQGCGNEIKLHPKTEQNFDNEVKQEIISTPPKEKELDSMWIVAAILLPIVGLLGGLYYAYKGRKGAGKVIAISIGTWIFFAILFNSVHYFKG